MSLVDEILNMDTKPTETQLVAKWNRVTTVGMRCYACISKTPGRNGRLGGSTYVAALITSQAYLKDGAAVADIKSSEKSGNLVRTLVLDDISTGGI